MDWVRGLFASKMPTDESEEWPAVRQKSSLTATLTGRLPSPGARIVLKTTENAEIFLTRQDLFSIKSLQRMVDDLEIDKNGDVTVQLPLCLSNNQMNKILAWFRSDQTSSLKTIFGQNVKELLKFIEIAQFLDINQLANLLAQHVADLLEKMTVDEIRQVLGREDKKPCTEEQLKDIQELKKLIDN